MHQAGISDPPAVGQNRDVTETWSACREPDSLGAPGQRSVGVLVHQTPFMLPQLLRATARRSPDRIALRGGELALTYRQLDHCVDVLAHQLRASGLRPADRIGLCMRRGALPLVLSAALMRAQCTYVPLDVRHPRSRLSHIVTNARLRTAVCDDAGRTVAQGLGLQAAEFDVDDVVVAARAQPPTDEQGPWLADTGLAGYVMYTSGSTGVPKGVEVLQANLSALVADALPLFGYGEDEVWPLLHGHGFDVSVWEMWAGIAVGATLVAVADDVADNPESLAALLMRHHATRLHAVPSVFGQLAEVVAESRLPIRLRSVAFCGEAVNYRAIQRWTEAVDGPQPRWLNVYGITETTVYNTFKVFSAAELARADPATSLGRAYRHSPALVLDADDQPSPVGEPGEILLGGRQVARGYLDNPQLTAERFVRLPGRAGRWYRTGDLAFTDADGELRFLGRRDDQVKVRGFRVELGEIDCALRKLGWLRDAAVLVQQSRRGEPLFTACVVLNSPGTDTGRSLLGRVRQELTADLPEHMLPNRVAVMDRLPLNSNGKTDRRALAAELG
jgi:amino acid adenylation domain-containing protein